MTTAKWCAARWPVCALATLVLTFAGQGRAQSAAAVPPFAPLEAYQRPEETLSALERANAAEKPSASIEGDRRRVRAAYLNMQLGRYQEAINDLFMLYAHVRTNTSSSADVQNAVCAIWPLVWSEIEYISGQLASSNAQLALADAATRALKVDGPWLQLRRAIKSKRFQRTLELLELAGMMDAQWRAKPNNKAPEMSLEMVLSAVHPEVFRLTDDGISIREDAMGLMFMDRPWREAVLRSARLQAEQLPDLDLLAYRDSSMAEAWRKSRESSILAAEGRLAEGIVLGRSAVETFRRLGAIDALCEALEQLLSELNGSKSRGSVEQAVLLGEELVAVHEQRAARLGVKGPRYIERHVDAYHRYLSALRRRFEHEPQGSHSPPTAIALVLQADRLQLRYVRREISAYRAISNSGRRDSALQEVREATSRLTEVSSQLQKTQNQGLDRGSFRADTTQGEHQLLQSKDLGGAVIFEAGDVSQKKPMTTEIGAYAARNVAATVGVDRVNEIASQAISDLGTAPELPASLAELQRGMEVDDGIVTFLEFDGDQTMMASLIKRDGDPRIVELKGKTLHEMKGLISALAASLSENDPGSSAKIEELSRLLWQPLGAMPRRLTVVLGQGLLGLPVEVLHEVDGQRVVDKHSIRYALGLSAEVGRSDVAGAYATADVVGAYDFSRAGLDPLEDSRAEVSAIRSALNAAGLRLEPVDTFPKRGRIWLDAANRIDVLHISTHAVADKSEPMFDRLVFPEDDLFGFDLAFSKSRANLAAFSACNLFSPRRSRFNPVSGITSASLPGVAPQVVTSLWDVESKETRVFMIAFYEELLAHRDPSLALTETKRLFLNDSVFKEWLASHHLSDPGNLRLPYYWASFVLAISPMPIAAETKH
jgi:hypothetical protein